MSDKYFCDTNVCLYALRIDEQEKADRAISLLATKPTISTQVLGETARTMLMRFHYDAQMHTDMHLRFLIESLRSRPWKLTITWED